MVENAKKHETEIELNQSWPNIHELFITRTTIVIPYVIREIDPKVLLCRVDEVDLRGTQGCQVHRLGGVQAVGVDQQLQTLQRQGRVLTDGTERGKWKFE